MEFAINFSHVAAELAEQKLIQVDRFKVPDWPELIDAAGKHGPIYVHFGINAGGDDSQTKDWKLAAEQARQSHTPFINLHLAARAENFAPGDSRAAVERMVEDIERAASFFGRERIIVENIPVGNPEQNFSVACGSPEGIGEIVRRTGAGLLLDLSHARLTAIHLGCDEREFVSAMPVDRIAELHLTGLGMVDSRLRDHVPMRDEDWEATQWAFDCIRSGVWARPKIVAFEYGGVGGKFEWRTDRSVIAEQVPRLYEMVQRCKGNGTRN